MLSFKSIVEMKKENNSLSYYNCNTCNLLKNNNPWAIYYNECKKCNVKICSYICFKKEYDTNKNIWNNLLNKKDFNLLMPIIPKVNKEFVIKSEEEINNMNKYEKNKYNKDLNKFFLENPNRAQMLYNIQRNIDIQNNFERNIELENYTSTSDEEYDDY